MLKGINPIVSPELLKGPLRNGSRRRACYCRRQFSLRKYWQKCNSYPCRRYHSTTDILDAVLSLIPLDTYTEKPVALMEVVKVTTPLPLQFGLNMTSF